MVAMLAASGLVMIELMFYLWANRIIIKPTTEKSTVIQGFLNRVMQILIAYFK
jgi:hypothetical protein